MESTSGRPRQLGDCVRFPRTDEPELQPHPVARPRPANDCRQGKWGLLPGENRVYDELCTKRKWVVRLHVHSTDGEILGPAWVPFESAGCAELHRQVDACALVVP